MKKNLNLFAPYFSWLFISILFLSATSIDAHSNRYSSFFTEDGEIPTVSTKLLNEISPNVQSYYFLNENAESLPWGESFESLSVPEGWTRNTFVIGSTIRIPGAESNTIYKNFRSVITTENFTTVSVGEIESGSQLSFDYLFTNYDAPYGEAPSPGAGNFIVAISTNDGLTYNDVQTIVSDGIAGWKTFQFDLSSYAGNNVKIKITGNWVDGNWLVGFDNFYIGNEITCEAPGNLDLSFVGSDSAQVQWESITNSEHYTWTIFESGADPLTDSPIQSGNTNTESVIINNLSSATEYDFYVQTDCGVNDGESALSEVLSFSTLCPAITDFPFIETFETNSSTLDCWYNETVIGNILWGLGAGAAGGNVNSSHNGTQNVLFFYDSPAANVTKLVSPPLDLSQVLVPKLTFWYANQEYDGGQNELRVYYKSSPSASWTLIPGAVYNTNVNQWTEVELSLPDANQEYYLAFEGTNGWGYGIVLDDISITDDFSCAETTVWDGLAWSNGEPDSSTKAVVNGNLILNSDLEACELEINENGSLEIPDGFNFTVHGTVSNLGTPENFIVKKGGNLIQIGNIENYGAITVEQDSDPMVRLEYTLWSSPVLGQTLQAFSPETLPNRIYTYEGTSGYVAVADANADFTPAMGYMFRAPNTWDSTVEAAYNGIFTGVPFNGNTSVATHSGSYTSIGNPYPSNLDADLLMDENAGIAALYFWVNTELVDGEYVGNNYATYTELGGTVADAGAEPSGIIAVGQGFIVETTDASVSFDNSMRTANPADFFKTNQVEKHRFWLNLSDGNNTALNQILIGYMDGATQGVDHQIDGKMFNYDGSAIYSIIDEQNFTIQGRALPFQDTDVVPLGFKALTNGKYNISLTNVDGLFSDGQLIYLKDNLLNNVHDLTDSRYEFESAAGEFKNRFEIVFEDEEIMATDDFATNKVLIYKNEDKIEILSKDYQILSIDVFDLSGRSLFRKSEIHSKTYQLDSSSFGKQIIIIRVQTDDGEIVSKKFIS